MQAQVNPNNVFSIFVVCCIDRTQILSTVFHFFSVPGLSHSTLSRTPLPGARDPHMVSASSKLWTPLIPHKQYHKPPGAADIYTKVNTSIRYCQDLGRGSESQVWSVFSVAEEIVLMPFGLSGHCPLASAAWQRIKLDKSREERRYRSEREDTHVARTKSSFNECPQKYAPCGILEFLISKYELWSGIRSCLPVLH